MATPDLMTDCANQTVSQLPLIFTILGTAIASITIVISLFNKLDTDIKSLSSKLDAETRASNARIDQVNERTDQTNQRLDQTNQRLDQTNQRLDQLYSTLIDLLKQQNSKSNP